MKLSIVATILLGLLTSSIGLLAQNCVDASTLKPLYLELNRTITESPFIGVREFVQNGTWPEYYREIQYSGNWGVSEHKSTWICHSGPLSGGPVSVEFEDSVIYDVATGQLLETGLATQTGYSSPSPGTVDLSNTMPGGTFPRASGGYIRLYVNPFGLSSETSTKRVWSRLPGGLTCSGGFMYQIGTRNLGIDRLFGRNITGNVVVTLTQNDTIEDALDNWSTRSGGTQVTDFGNDAYLVRDDTEVRQAALEIEAEFEGCVDEILTVHMITQKTDLSINQTSEDEETFSLTVDSNGRAVFKHKLEATLSQRVSLVSLFATKEASCNKDIGNPYSSNGSVNSLHWYTSIGSLNDGQSAGQLRVDKEDWSDLAYTPADLTFYNPIPALVSVIEINDIIRQVLTPKDIVDVVVLGSDSYRIDIHDLSNAGIADPVTGVYTITGVAHTSYTLSKQTVGSELRLRVVEAGRASSGVTEFAFSLVGDVETWTVYTGSGERGVEQISEELSEVPTGLEVTDHFSRPYVPAGFSPELYPWTESPVYVSKIEQVKNSVGSIVTKKEYIYQEVTLGSGFSQEFSEFASPHTFELLRRERVFIDSLTIPAYEITYFYGTDDSRSDFTRLVRTENSRGNWEKRRYDSEGRLWQVESSYLDSALSDPESSNRLTTYTYSEVADIDSDGEPESLVTLTKSLLGLDVSRSFKLELSGTNVLNNVEVSETREIVGLTPVATWDTDGNLVTRVWEYADEVSEFYMEEYARSNPDGTGSIRLLIRNSDNTLTVTESVGALNSGTVPTFITAGMLTVKVQDSSGSNLITTTTDVESGLTIAQASYANFDDYGRAQRIDYLDGTYEIRQFTCCGLLSVTGRDGQTTLYDYDDLNRVEFTTTAYGSMAQQVERSVYDSVGNLQERYLGASDTSLSLVAEYDYDYRGQLTTIRERYLDAVPSTDRETTIVEVIDTLGYIVTTRTYPNDSTRIEKRYSDGSLFEVTGSATREMRYAYGVENDENLGYPVATQTSTYIKSDSSLSGEYSKRFTDALGRTYKTEQATASGGIAAVENTYYANGQLKASSDADGQTLLYAYNSEGEREVVALDTDGSGSIEYDGVDRITRTRNSYATRSEGGDSYTVERQTVEVWNTDNVDSAQINSSTERSLNGLLGSDVISLVWETIYGQATHKQTVLDRASATATTIITLPDGSYQVSVVSNGLLETFSRHHSDTKILSQYTNYYDSSDENRLDYVVDLYQGTTDYEYYADGQLKSVTTPDPDDTKSGSGYDPQLTSYAYTDSAVEISRTTTLPDSTTHTESYYSTGEIKEFSGSQTYPVAYVYDYAGRLIEQTTWHDKGTLSGEVLTAWEYYSNGLLKKKWYDASVGIDGTISGTSGDSFTYTNAGRLQSKLNARGVTKTFTYDPDSADLTGTAYDDGITPAVSYSAYDREGRLKTVTDASGTRSMTYQNGILMDEEYTSGVLIGFKIDRRQDALNRIDQIFLKQALRDVHQVDYGYDGASRLHTVSHRQHTVTHSYTPENELKQVQTFNNGVVDQITVNHRYDKLNRLKSRESIVTGGAIRSYNYQYNNLNQRERMTLADNSYWQYGFDNLGQVDSAAFKNVEDVVFPGRSLGFTFDDIGNRTQTTTNGRVATYTPNNLNEYNQRQIPRAVDVSGDANPVARITINGNAATRVGDYFYHELDLSGGGDSAQQTTITVTGSLPDGGDNNAPRVADAQKSEYLSSNPEVFDYDDDGNLTSDGKWTYSWDAENRLIEMETRSQAYNGGAPRLKLTFGYDSTGRRFNKQVQEWNHSTSSYQLSVDTLYIYDTWNLIYEYAKNADGSSASKEYVWGNDMSGAMQGAGGVGGLLMTVHANKTIYYPTFDGSGNIMAYHDADNKDAVAEFEYGPFGELIRATGSKKDEFNFRFSTKYEDAETGLLYYGYRYYDPATGRWLSRDPIEESGGLNLYGFNYNSTVNYYDYLGMGPILHSHGDEGVEIVIAFEGVVKTTVPVVNSKATLGITGAVLGAAASKQSADETEGEKCNEVCMYHYSDNLIAGKLARQSWVTKQRYEFGHSAVIHTGIRTSSRNIIRYFVCGKPNAFMLGNPSTVTPRPGIIGGADQWIVVGEVNIRSFQKLPYGNYENPNAKKKL